MTFPTRSSLSRIRFIAAFVALLGIALWAAAERDGAQAGAGPNINPVQNFNVDANVCYGASPGFSATCPIGTDTAALAGSNGLQYLVLKAAHGSRIGDVTHYVAGFPANPTPAYGASTSLTMDLRCNQTPEALSDVPVFGLGGVYPDDYQTALSVGAPPTYVTAQKPTPGTYALYAYAGGDATQVHESYLWSGPLIDYRAAPLAYDVMLETVSYYPTVTAITPMIGKELTPPNNDFDFCADSPMDTVGISDLSLTPPSQGLYARWSMISSAPDLRSGTRSRIVDLQCVNVGGAILTDKDKDCLHAGLDPDDLRPDQDGDLLFDGIEATWGTQLTFGALCGGVGPHTTGQDNDCDGATDFAEMAEHTRPSNTAADYVVDCAPIPDPDGPGPDTGIDSPYPNDVDTDCDGQRDPAENGADSNPATKGVFDDDDSDDNCPAHPNPLQINSDSAAVPNFLGSGDLSINAQDVEGDACDEDDDNDGLSDLVEGAMDLGAAPSFCAVDAAPPSPSLVTSPTDPDSDNDLALDGAECRFASRPDKANNPDGRMITATSDFLGDGATGSPETFYRTQRIGIPAGGQTDDLDSDNLCGGMPLGADCNGGTDNDSDADSILDGTEALLYGSSPSNDDTDGDGCKDGTEAADVNGDRNINVLDLSHVATKSSTTPFPGGRYRDLPTGTGEYTVVDYVALDYNRDGSLNALDLSAIAAQIALPGTTENCGGLNPGVAQGGIFWFSQNSSPAP